MLKNFETPKEARDYVKRVGGCKIATSVMHPFHLADLFRTAEQAMLRDIACSVV